MNTRKLTFLALCVALNVVGSFIVISTRLPLFLDTVGTLLTTFLLGPIYGAVTGAITYIISGSTFDPVGYFFIPTQIAVGLTGGILYKMNFFTGWKKMPAILIITLFSATVSAIIAAFAFNGITSSGTSYIVQVIHAIGIPLFASVYIVQVLSEIPDKIITVLLALMIFQRLPAQTKYQLISKTGLR